ncbi:MAG: isomerizing glutamine--fructose-6-phosphate transaminase, partial [Patescibacteria group bacterium]
MCGIFAYTGARTNASQLVLEGLKSLEYRGYDSWGIGSVNRNTISVIKEVGKIGNATTKGLPSVSSCVFGHTRWATHGGVTIQNTHPHLDCTRHIALIHNGIVENYEDLKKELLIKKHHFTSETDSEVVVHLVEEYRKKCSLGESIRKAFLRCKGLSAFIVFEVNSKTIFAVKNGSPLVIGFGKNENFLASDAAALLPHTRSVRFVEDGNFVEINPHKVLVRNIKTNKILSIKKQILNWKIAQVEKGTFPYFMLKEIHEQAPLLLNIAHAPLTDINTLAEQAKKAQKIFLVACGTAAYGCMAGSYFFSKIAKYQVSWSVASEFGYQLDFLNKESLVIALSQSGETMDTLEAIKKAKEKDARIGTLVNSFGSTLYREANYNVLVGAGPEKSVASTKA